MEILNFLKCLQKECIRNSEHIRFEKKHPRHLYLVALYGSLIEMADSLTTLIDRKHRTVVPQIFRSFLEAYVELKNLHEKSEYVFYMEASHHDHWIKILKEARKKSNPYLESIGDMDAIDKQIKIHGENLIELKKKGYSPLHVVQKFERADMANEYRSVYRFLSRDAHSNIEALVSRHLAIHKNDFAVVYYKDEPLTGYLRYLDSTASFLLDASRRIHRFFKTGAVNGIEELTKEFKAIRSRYSSLS